ncbi:MAG: DUF411 domain-containing protein [Gemmatimonadota bacterium]
MRSLTGIRAFAALFAVGIVASGCSEVAADAPEMTAHAPEMTVYATPTCGCCGAWIEHIRESGITVQVVYQDDLSAIRAEHELPRDLMSCHMGVIDGFAVEGHVPADVVQRMLVERPAILGIAAPGMPIGSPGMEHPDGLTQPYEIYSWDESGPKAVYEVRN